MEPKKNSPVEQGVKTAPTSSTTGDVKPPVGISEREKIEKLVPETVFEFDASVSTKLDVNNPYSDLVELRWGRKDSVDDAALKGWSCDIPDAIIKANPSFDITSRLGAQSAFGISQRSGTGAVTRNEMVLQVRNKRDGDKIRQAEHQKAKDALDERKGEELRDEKGRLPASESGAETRKKIQRLEDEVREMRAEMRRKELGSTTVGFNNLDGLTAEYKEKLSHTT